MNKAAHEAMVLVRRIVWGWRCREWPWKVPRTVGLYLPLRQKLTEKDIRRGQQLARERGWLRGER